MTDSSRATTPLAGRHFWLTRPAAQGQDLQHALEQLGARIFSLPLLQIVPVPVEGENKQRLLDLDSYDLVFYVSSNAASIGLDAIGNYWPQYPSHILNFSVGPGTAKVIQSYGLEVFYPVERTDSEALLALPQLQDIHGKKALIVRGVGGREVLSQGLLARGASVAYAELYQRHLPNYDAAWLQQCLQHSPDAVVVSSSEALDNLRILLQPLGSGWRQLVLCVASDRLASHAHALGFAHAVVLAAASDAAIIAGLLSAFAPMDSR